MALVDSCFLIFISIPFAIAMGSKGNIRLSKPQDPFISGKKQIVPSNTRTMYLYSITGRFLEITENGKLRGAINTNSKGTLLQVQSIGVAHRRIKRAGSNTFIAINKTGKPYAQNQRDPNLETLFQEIVNKRFVVAYQNVLHGWLLAIKKNGKLRRGLKQSRDGSLPRSARFLVIFPS